MVEETSEDLGYSLLLHVSSAKVAGQIPSIDGINNYDVCTQY